MLIGGIPFTVEMLGATEQCLELLPTARKLAVRMARRARRKGKAAAKAFDLPGGKASIEIGRPHGANRRQTGTLRLEAGAVGYQFWTSGRIDNFYHGTGIYGGLPFTAGRLVSAAFPSGRTKPLVEAADPVYTAAWPVVPAYGIDFGAQALEGVWNNQRFYEYSSWVGNKLGHLVVSAAGMAPAQANLGGLLSPFSRGGFIEPLALEFAADTGEDIAARYHERTNATTAYLKIAGLPSPRWQRRAAVQRAGGRRFVVATDALTRFYVYPLRNYSPGGIAHDDPRVRALDAPYPAWVNQTLPDSYHARWTWEFNKDGTKAVCVPFKSVYPATAARVFSGVLFEASSPPELFAAASPPREDFYGLVEVNINIAVTGPNEEDFTASLSLGRTIPPDSGRTVLAASYAFKDARLKGVADEDDLVTLEAAVYVQPDVLEFLAGSWPQDPRLITQDVFGANLYEWQAADTLTLASQDIGHAGADIFLLLNANDAAGAVKHSVNLPLGTGTGFSFIYQPMATLDPGNGVNYALTHGSTWEAVTRQPALGFEYGDSDRVFPEVIDLRTFSVVAGHEQWDAQYLPAAERRNGWRCWMYNKLEGSGQTGTANLPLSTTDKTRLPPSMANIEVRVAKFYFRPSLLRTFAHSPQGDIAIALRELSLGNVNRRDVDIVLPKGGKKTTHRELYNKAFGDARGYDFFTADPDKLEGSFKTAGFFF